MILSFSEFSGGMACCRTSHPIAHASAMVSNTTIAAGGIIHDGEDPAGPGVPEVRGVLVHSIQNTLLLLLLGIHIVGRKISLADLLLLLHRGMRKAMDLVTVPLDVSWRQGSVR